MSDAVAHPSPEVLADHHENTLPAEQALWVNDHIADCAECRDLLDALGEVQNALRDAGTVSTPMPTDVAAGIEGAIATEAQRRAAVVPFPSARDREASAERHRRRSRLLVAAGTIAVLAIGGVIGGSQLSRDSGGRQASSSASDKGESQSSAGGANSSEKLSKSGPRVISPRFSINPQNFDSVLPLARGFDTGASGGPRACLAKAVPRYRPGTWRSVQVTWSGKPAWVLVSPSRTEGYVVDCSGTPRVLYHHAF